LTVLDRIIEAKYREVDALRGRRERLERAAVARPPVAGFRDALTAGSTVALIAEVKRRSPSAGSIAEVAGAGGARDAAMRYEAAGAAAVSVLTDADHFGGSLGDLSAVTEAVAVPVLRKDFIIDELQILEARAAGASAVLLIVRILDDTRLAELLGATRVQGLTALVEVHDEAELDRALDAGADTIGVNNRDLTTFETDPGTTLRLAPRVPPECVLVAESGIRTVADVEAVAAAGAHAVLVGESLMRAPEPIALARSLAGVRRR
jgi:indole-3-glycerol phosphate synthase